MADPQKIYRLFLKLYPARFREEYEAPLERQFVDEYSEAYNGEGSFLVPGPFRSGHIDSR